MIYLLLIFQYDENQPVINNEVNRIPPVQPPAQAPLAQDEAAMRRNQIQVDNNKSINSLMF